MSVHFSSHASTPRGWPSLLGQSNAVNAGNSLQKQSGGQRKGLLQTGNAKPASSRHLIQNNDQHFMAQTGATYRLYLAPQTTSL